MSVSFKGFNVALLDSTFFFSVFSPELKSFLQATCVYTANTFDQEIKQFKQILPSDQASAYAKNVNFLSENVKLNSLRLSTAGDDAQDLHEDIWGLITLLTRLGQSRFVVLTANALLIQRIVLNDMHVSVYNLRTNELIHADDARAKASIQREFVPTKATISHIAFKGEEGKRLYRKNGTHVTLSREIRTGMEATLYMLENQPGLIAKIYLTGQLPPEKLSHLQRLVDMEKPNVSWAVFPLEMLYYDQACTDPAGFIESYVKTSASLDEIKLFLGKIDTLEEEWLSKDVLYPIEICLKVVRQVCYLNCYGFYVSDFNLGNLSIISNQSLNIQMWDTDSYGYTGYFSAAHDGNKKSRSYDTSLKTGAIEFCSDALYVMVFYLLTLGDAPMSEFAKGGFKYDKPNYRLSYRRELMPDNIWSLLATVFRQQKAPSSEALLYELSVTQALLTKSSVTNKTYKQLLREHLSAGASNSNTAGPEHTADNNHTVPIDTTSVTTHPSSGGNSGQTTTNGKPETKKVSRAIVIFILLLILGTLIGIVQPYLNTLNLSNISQSDSFSTIQIVTVGDNTIAVSPGETVRVRFTAPSAGTYVFTTKGSADTYGYLYTSVSGGHIDSDDDDGTDNNFLLERTLTANETIYVGVKYYNSSVSGNVILNIEKKSVNSSIRTVSTGDNTIAVSSGETVRVKFAAPSAGTYVFTTKGSVDTYGYLYTSVSGGHVDSDDDDGTDNNFLLERTLSANETIYVGVKYYSSSISGNVTLNIEKGGVFELSSNISMNKGHATVSWTDTANNSPYEVAYQCVGKDGVSHPSYWAGGDQLSSTTHAKSFTIDELIPGKTYKIMVTDCNGRVITRNYTIPSVSTFVDGKLPASSINITIQPRSKSYGVSDSSANSISTLRASDIMSNRYSKEYGFRYEIEYPQLAYSRTYFTQVAIIAPNGYTECEIHNTIEYGREYSGHYWHMVGDWTFQKMYEYNSSIPSGTWTVELYWDGMFVNRSTFTVQ